LETCQKLPPDAERIVFDIMMTCSVERFKQHFQTLDSSESMKLRTYDSVLREAVRYYTILHTGIDQWLPLSKTNSMYLGNSATEGAVQHLPRGPPKEKTKATHDAKGNLIDRNAPAKGAPIVRDSKLIEGRKEYWCSTCDRWGSHDAEHHDSWKQKTKEFFANRKAGKNKDGTPAPGYANAASGSSTTPDDASTFVSTPSVPPSTVVTGASNFTMVERLQRAGFADA
jgi:hypothetical protein